MPDFAFSKQIFKILLGHFYDPSPSHPQIYFRLINKYKRWPFGSGIVVHLTGQLFTTGMIDCLPVEAIKVYGKEREGFARFGRYLRMGD